MKLIDVPEKDHIVRVPRAAQDRGGVWQKRRWMREIFNHLPESCISEFQSTVNWQSVDESP
eukprot:9896556-Karenia_brevis.AAC.1